MTVDSELAAALQTDSSRFDVDGDGRIGPADEALARRVIETELRSRPPGDSSPTLASRPQVLDGRWEVCGVLGTGGQGRTYLARDLETRRHVAVKELDVGRVDDWKAVELFEREADTLARLNHPRIPKYVDRITHQRDGRVTFYLVQEFVHGATLAEDLKMHGPLREQDAAAVRDALFDVLQYLHSFQPPIVHRDIKPANLLRTQDGRIVLVDFGAVQVAGRTIGGSTVIGTQGYMPLEQVAMGRATPATDLYAVGATLAHLMTGQHPSQLPVQNHRLLVEEVVHASSPFVNGLVHLLEPAVENRPQTVHEARAHFNTALVAPRCAGRQTKKSNPVVLGAAIVTLLALVGYAVHSVNQAMIVPIVPIDNVFETRPENALHVAFFGNSHTYQGPVPRYVQHLVPKDQPPMWFDAQAAPGVLLEWHADRLALLDGGQSVVVLQPQSTEPITSPDAFSAGLARLEARIPEGMRVVVWVPWARDPDSDIYGFYDHFGIKGDSVEKFDLMTDELEKRVRTWAGRSEVCPIGDAMRLARKQTGEKLISTNDGNKVDYDGAYLVSTMLYMCIYRADPTKIENVPTNVDDALAEQLRAVAADVGRKSNIF